MQILGAVRQIETLNLLDSGHRPSMLDIDIDIDDGAVRILQVQGKFIFPSVLYL